MLDGSTLVGSMVTLTPLGSRHLERTRAWANDPELRRLLNRAAEVSEAEHQVWFADLASRKDRAYLAIALNGSGRHIGNVWLWAIDDVHGKAELRIVVGDGASRGRGAGTEAIALACRYGFGARDLHRIYAYVLAFNTPAIRSFEKAGFRVEGVLREDRLSEGRFVDAVLLARLRGDQPASRG